MILLFASIILMLALFAINLSTKSGIPSLLLFLVLGIACSFLGVDFADYQFSEKFATFALIVIMFYGGFGTNWKMGKPVVKEAAILASLGVVFTALLTGYFIYLVFKLPFLESMLIGSIVGSTDYASVSNILKSKNLNLKYSTAPLLEVESGSNDPFAYTMTMLFLSLILGEKVSVPIMILKQIGLGVLFGFLFAFICGKLLKVINLQKDGIATIFMAAMALFAYSFTSVIGGNGYLTCYIFGIIVGNMHFIGKKDIVFFFDGFSELMNIGLFFLLGLLATPSRIIASLPIAFAIMLFMTFVARPVSVVGLMLPFKLKKNQLLVISWAGLRGAAAIAFAIMATNAGNGGKLYSVDVYHIVFGICFLSSIIQASFMAAIAIKTDMLDKSDTVLNTFNYYSDKSDIGFLKTEITEKSNLAGKKVKDLNLVFNFIIAKIRRDDKTIIPRGEVVLEQGDTLVFAGEEYFDPHGHEIIEFSIDKNHPWANKKIVDLHLPPNRLILAINRSGTFIRAAGATVIHADDRILLITDEEIDITANNPNLIE